jgi:HlyD family secretion protein
MGTLTAVVGATGTVRANRSASMNFQTSGTVGVVHVQPGDNVGKGEVLVELDAASLPGKITQAKSALISAQEALDQLTNSESATTQAQLALANATQTLRHVTYIRWINQQGNRASEGTLNGAEANIALAQNAVSAAEAAYNAATSALHGAAAGSPLSSKLEQAQFAAQANLSSAQLKRASAQAVLNWYLGSPSPADQAIYDADVAAAQAAVEDAQRAYDRVRNGPNPDDVAAARVQVAAAQATLQQAEITSPFAGTVTLVVVHPGDQAKPATPAVVVSDLSKYLVDVQVSEVDIDKVKVGQAASLSFDAIPNKTYRGVVTEVGMTGVTVSGVVDFAVTVEITESDAAIRPGMTAAVNLTVSQVPGALLIPNRAVRTQNNQQTVYVLRNGTATPVKIKLGASSDTFSQVLSGDVKEGDLIVVNPPTSLFSAGPGGGFGGGGGFSGG